MLISPAFAQAGGTVAAGSTFTGTMLQLLLIFVIFYLLLIRPQQKRMKEHEAMLKAIKRGDNILTGGGVYANVVEVFDDKDELKAEIADGVVISVARSCVRDVITLDKTAEVKKEKTTKKSKK